MIPNGARNFGLRLRERLVIHPFFWIFLYNKIVDERIEKRIRELRNERHMTQSRLGDILCVSQDTVSLWEKGKSIPSADQVIRLCKIFGVSADYLLGLSDY